MYIVVFRKDMNSRMSDDEIFVNKDFMCLRALAARPDVVLQLHEGRWVVEEPVRFQQLFRPSCVGAYVYQMACREECGAAHSR